MTYQTITAEADSGIATITLNRPDKANAINPQMRDELDDALARYRSDDHARVIRLRATGRVFCAGYDLSSGQSVYNAELPTEAPVDVPHVDQAPDPTDSGPRMTELGDSMVVLDRERLRESIERWLRIWNYGKPIVAQVHGPCLAGGLDLIGVCDIVYAARNASFGHPAARGMGIPPTLGMLPKIIGAARTKELLFTGDTIDGEEAHRLGLVNAVVADEELDARTTTLCRRIAANAPDALTLHKHLVNRWDEIAGVRTAVLEGAEFDAMFHLTRASSHFGRIAARDGLRSALAWRDAGFADDQTAND